MIKRRTSGMMLTRINRAEAALQEAYNLLYFRAGLVQDGHEQLRKDLHDVMKQVGVFAYNRVIKLTEKKEKHV